MYIYLSLPSTLTAAARKRNTTYVSFIHICGWHKVGAGWCKIRRPTRQYIYLNLSIRKRRHETGHPQTTRSCACDTRRTKSARVNRKSCGARSFVVTPPGSSLCKRWGLCT